MNLSIQTCFGAPKPLAQGEIAMTSLTRKGIVSFCLVVVCAVLISVQAGQTTTKASRNSSNSFASANWFPATGNSGVVANSSSVMIRNADGVAYTISTTGLLPGGAYTNWWVIFNEPQFCSPPGCGADDFPQNGGNPNAGASVLWATGRVVDANGQGNFASHLAAGGVSSAPGQVLFGPALLNPRAEIHIIVRSHGPASGDPNVLQLQLTTVAGGCSLSNPCQDQQFVLHLP